MTSSDNLGHRLGRIIVTAVAIITGFLVLIHTFSTQAQENFLGLPGLKAQFDQAGTSLISIATIIASFALLIGFFNVVTSHWHRIQSQKPDFIYSIVLLVALLLTLVLGLSGPTSQGARFMFEFILQPLESTFFALLALFVATAVFRAFRVRNLETLLFVIFALIVLLGQVPVSIYLWSELPVIKDWILTVPTMAGVRGILLGVALGTIATGLRILLGTDRPYSN
ncbi:MAG: hypothetical protein R3264_01640 [Anaerolineae bacterium]|nr:hypothetical protein [Anaerolineae bacterium]